MYRLFVAVFILVFAATTNSHAQSLSDGVEFRTWAEFKRTGLSGEYGDCKLLEYPLSGKIYGGLGGEAPLTDAEFVELVGSSHAMFGILGGTKFYVRSNGKLMETGAAYLMTQGIDTSDQSILKDPERFSKMQRLAQAFNADSIPNDTPILCGSGAEEERIKKLDGKILAAKKAERARYEATCEACTLPAGDLLQAIYDGDFMGQYRIISGYLGELYRASGGSEGLSHMTLLVYAQGNADMSMLEEMLGYYILATSRNWADRCYSANSINIPLTTKYADQVYKTLGGIEIGRDKGFTRVTNYRFEPKFSDACRKACNRNGNFLLAGVAAGGLNKKLGVMETFRGLDQFIQKYDCQSSQVRQFEDNLLALWSEERSRSSMPRNSYMSLIQ